MCDRFDVVVDDVVVRLLDYRHGLVRHRGCLLVDDGDDGDDDDRRFGDYLRLVGLYLEG